MEANQLRGQLRREAPRGALSNKQLQLSIDRMTSPSDMTALLPPAPNSVLAPHRVPELSTAVHMSPLRPGAMNHGRIAWAGVASRPPPHDEVLLSE